jgi:hypothetical protein
MAVNPTASAPMPYSSRASMHRMILGVGRLGETLAEGPQRR